MNNDIINGLFEFTGGILYIINIVRLIKDKEVKGVSWVPVLFFSLWGLWNLYYYPSLDQTFSFIGGIVIVSVNIIWLALVFYYKKIYKNHIKHKDFMDIPTAENYTAIINAMSNHDFTKKP